jgi:hypothetical protein
MNPFYLFLNYKPPQKLIETTWIQNKIKIITVDWAGIKTCKNGEKNIINKYVHNFWYRIS